MAARRIHAGLVHVGQHVVVHQVGALPGWVEWAGLRVMLRMQEEEMVVEERRVTAQGGREEGGSIRKHATNGKS